MEVLEAISSVSCSALVLALAEENKPTKEIAAMLFTLKCPSARQMLAKVLERIGDEFENEELFGQAIEEVAESFSSGKVTIDQDDIDAIKEDLSDLDPDFVSELAFHLAHTVDKGLQMEQPPLYVYGETAMDDVRSVAEDHVDVLPSMITDMEDNQLFCELTQQYIDEVAANYVCGAPGTPESILEHGTAIVPVAMNIVPKPRIVDVPENVDACGFPNSAKPGPDDFVFVQNVAILKYLKGTTGYKRFAGVAEIFEPIYGDGCLKSGNYVFFERDTPPSEGKGAALVTGVRVPSPIAKFYRALGTGPGKQFYMHKLNRRKVFGWFADRKKASRGEKAKKKPGKRPPSPSPERESPQPERSWASEVDSESEDAHESPPVDERERGSRRKRDTFVLDSETVEDILATRPTYSSFAENNMCGEWVCAALRDFARSSKGTRTKKLVGTFMTTLREHYGCGISFVKFINEARTQVKNWFSRLRRFPAETDAYAAFLVCFASSGLRVKDDRVIF